MVLFRSTRRFLILKIMRNSTKPAKKAQGASNATEAQPPREEKTFRAATHLKEFYVKLNAAHQRYGQREEPLDHSEDSFILIVNIKGMECICPANEYELEYSDIPKIMHVLRKVQNSQKLLTA